MYNNLPQQAYPPYGYPNQQFARFEAPQQGLIKGRPVVSIDEARASQIDLDGSLYVFPDLGNKKIYTKQINIDGTATFNVYELSAPALSPATPDYVTREELEKAMAELRQSFTQRNAEKAAPAQVTAQINKSFNI